MSALLLAAGILSLLTCLAHVIGGGKEFHLPMRASALPAPERAVWSIVWHQITALLALNGAALIAAACRPDQAPEIAALPVALSAAFAVLFPFFSHSHLGSVRALPQWTAFLAITGLGLAGLMIGA